MRQDSAQLGLADYAGIVWQRRRAALLAAGIFACATFIVFNCLSRRYAASAVFERHGDIVAAQTEKFLPASFTTLKPMLAYELTGSAAVRTALEQVGYADHLPKDSGGELTGDAQARLSRAAEQISRNLRLKWLVNTPNLDTVSLSVTSDDPVLACSLANQLVNNYIGRTRQTLLDQLTDSAEFLTERIAAARGRVDEHRQQLRQFMAEHPNAMPDNPQRLSEQMAELDVQVEDLVQQRKDLEARLGTLAEQAQSGPDARSTPEYHELSERLGEYQEVLAQAQNIHGMTDRHPKVLKLRRSIADARQQMAELSNGGGTAGPAMSLAVEDAQSALRRVDSLVERKRRQREALAEAQANALPIIHEFERLTDLIEEAEAEADLWQRSRATVQLALEAEQNGTRTHLKVIKAAGPVHRPVWPALWHVFFIALAGAAGSGVIMAIGLSRLSGRFASAAEAAATMTVPLLGVIGPILSPASRRLAALRRYVLVPAGVCLLLLVTLAAAIGVVLSTQYPGQYVQLKQHFVPTAWNGLRQVLGAS